MGGCARNRCLYIIHFFPPYFLPISRYKLDCQTYLSIAGYSPPLRHHSDSHSQTTHDVMHLLPSGAERERKSNSFGNAPLDPPSCALLNSNHIRTQQTLKQSKKDACTIGAEIMRSVLGIERQYEGDRNSEIVNCRSVQMGCWRVRRLIIEILSAASLAMDGLAQSMIG